METQCEHGKASSWKYNMISLLMEGEMEMWAWKDSFTGQIQCSAVACREIKESNSWLQMGHGLPENITGDVENKFCLFQCKQCY